MPVTVRRRRNKRKHPQAELEKELRRCAFRGDLDRIRELVLDHRVAVDCSDEEGYTPLMSASYWGHAHVARFLLENNGASSLEAADADGDTALSFAVFNGEVAVAQVLLEYGADVDRPCYDGRYSPLGFALCEKLIDMVALLLRHGAKTAETLSEDENHSALWVACNLENSLDIVQLVLNHDNGAYIDSFAPRCTGYAAAAAATSPLCKACRRDDLNVAKLLIQNGARVIFPRDYPDNPSPLVNAVEKGSFALVQFLLENSPFAALSGAITNNRLETTEGGLLHHRLTKPLEFALDGNKLQVAQLLVDYGANVNAAPFLGWCAAKRSDDRCCVESARFLLRAGAHINHADRSDGGKTPLWIAAAHGNVPLIQELLKAGADLNVRNHGGETPLGVAHRKDHKGAVYALLRTSPHVWPRLRKFI